MNYRHAFHAGNFADLLKHAALILVLDRLMAVDGPLLTADSHAGAGIYDLGGDLARKSGESDAGVGRLMGDDAAPGALAALKAAVRKVNARGALRFYPGSPVLIAQRLRPQDQYIGAELRPDDFAALSQALSVAGGPASVVQTDGYALLKAQAADRRRLFALIDPPFEQPDDYERIIDAVMPLLRRRVPATVMIWLPLKDLETYDSFLRKLEALEPPDTLAVEARLAPLTDPMKMNGCVLVLINPPAGLEPSLRAVAEWIVASAGAPGGIAKLWRLAG